MRSYPTLEQFSQHPCLHWARHDNEAYCTMYDKPLTDPDLGCQPQCPHYDPWDCSVEELSQQSKPNQLPALTIA